MGLLSSLALALIPLARFGDRIPVKTSTVKLEARIKELERELSEACADRDRWEALAHRWEARYEQAINPILEREIAAQVRQQAMLNQAIAQHQNAQIQAQQAMSAQNFYNGSPFQQLGQAQLGQGILSHALQGYGFCNCVPARHDMLLRGDN